MVRFAPDRPGRWQFKLLAQDKSGSMETSPHSFGVGASSNAGFIRVSRRDPRYFEFDNGRYFPGLGYNMNANSISWVNPVLDNQANFRKMWENGGSGCRNGVSTARRGTRGLRSILPRTANISQVLR
jgi:hypothetical protein